MTSTLEPLLDAAGLQVFERGWLSANNVLVDPKEGGETVLIDTGYATHADQTLALVRTALGSRSLDRVINTHLHSDHCGGNHALQYAFNCAIDVPAGEARKVDQWDEAALTYVSTGQSCPRFRRTGVVRDGQVVQLGQFLWRVIAAPGHDPESVVFHQPDLALLISADALWQNGFGVVFPELEGAEAFADVRATLETLDALSIEWVIPGHGKPFGNVREALDRAHSRLDSFLSDPRRHGRYAAKVLIKFHLLEVQHASSEVLALWLRGTPYLQMCHQRYFAKIKFDDWCAELMHELTLSGALSVRDGVVVNL